MDDERFAHISSDPRFRTTPKSVRKVKIDKRFQSLFTDKRFQLKYSVDKRGKPVDQSSHENFRKYYELSSESESSDDENGETPNVDDKESQGLNTTVYNEESENKSRRQSNKWTVTSKSSNIENEENIKDEYSNDETGINSNEVKVKDKPKNINQVDDSDRTEKLRMTDEIKMKLRDPNIDYSRGVGALFSESSSDEDSSADSESESEEEFDHGWGELDRDAETTDDATDRVAVLHMDWDRIRAVDLMVLFNSFLPQDGVIECVTIYPSQFGLERLKEEEENGPPELVTAKDKKEDVDEEGKEGKTYHMERLRQYQLNRLKYYYAVIKFDSADTANKVYNECDGLEYESSATKLDLRFVPEGETFDQEPHDVCTSMPDPSRYQPRVFINTALQQGKVELTWDETDPDRLEFTKKIQQNADVIDNTDLQAYLAYSSEEDSDNEDLIKKEDTESDEENMKEDDKIEKYKSLLASLEEEEEKKKNRDVDLEITWGVGLKEKAEKSIKEKLSTPKTPFEEMMEKRKQKKKMKREERLKKKIKTEESDAEDDLYSDDDFPSDIDMNDPYFKEELTGPKKSKNKTIKEEEPEVSQQSKAELELLLLEEDESEKKKSHFNIKSIQEQENERKKKKRRKQLKKKQQEAIPPQKDDFEVDVADNRFGALFTSHHFNIDPADPQYRKTKAMDTIISEKLKRRQKELEQEIVPKKQTKTDPELSLLVNSIKKKTKHKEWK